MRWNELSIGRQVAIIGLVSVPTILIWIYAYRKSLGLPIGFLLGAGVSNVAVSALLLVGAVSQETAADLKGVGGPLP